DILIPAGPTSLPAGPAIGDLQKAGIPASVEGAKIAVKKDTVVVKAGQTISKEVAGALAKLGIEPMEIGLDLLAVLDNGTIYKKDILFIPREKYVDDLKSAYLNALNLSVGIDFVVKENVKFFISKAYKNALNLAVNGKIVNEESIKYLLQKANAEMQTLQSKIKTEG
ncbi:MAG TPA: 50S ribosomal protein L10, partial [archaeon]|nr:50S ribosomal protein L10 [archaeon]